MLKSADAAPLSRSLAMPEVVTGGKGSHDERLARRADDQLDIALWPRKSGIEMNIKEAATTE